MLDKIHGDAKQEFDLHVAFLTETSKLFVDNTSKVSGFLLLALGWFATSKEARSYLGSVPHISQLAAVAVAAAYILSVGASWVTYRSSAITYQRLLALKYLPETTYDARKLGLPVFIICVIGNGVLAGLLVVALLTVSCS